MRTNIDIDEALMAQAMMAGPFKTKKDAVDAGLKLLARQAARREILRWRGKLRWEGDEGVQRCALVRALWAHIQQRDWAAMRAAFTDDAVMHWPVTGERFEGADLIVRANAEYPEGWSIEVKAVDALADGRVHSLVEVRHGDGLFFGHSRFEFRGPSIAAVQEHWSTAEAPPAWRATLGAGYRRG